MATLTTFDALKGRPVLVLKYSPLFLLYVDPILKLYCVDYGFSNIARVPRVPGLLEPNESEFISPVADM